MSDSRVSKIASVISEDINSSLHLAEADVDLEPETGPEMEPGAEVGPDPEMGPEPEPEAAASIQRTIISPSLQPYGDWVKVWFGGDENAAAQAEGEAYSALETETGCKMVDNESTPGEFVFDCPSEEAFTKLVEMLRDAAMERPDTPLDIIFSLMYNNARVRKGETAAAAEPEPEVAPEPDVAGPEMDEPEM